MKNISYSQEDYLLEKALEESKGRNVDHITINIDKKPFGKYKVISEKAFNNDIVVQIRFVNQSFIWIPTWPEIGAIVEALFIAENINRINRNRKELSFLEHLKKMKMSINLNDLYKKNR